MEIIPFKEEHVPEAANLFTRQFTLLRKQVPILPDTMENPSGTIDKLQWIANAFAGVAAVEKGQLVGYLLWLYADHFRDADRKGAYVPEWAHAALDSRTGVYQAMYRAAGVHWAKDGRQTHAITLMANDPESEKAWYWSGFGLLVIDAIRPAEPLAVRPDCSLTVRKATLADVEAFCLLDEEHCQHYTQSPIFMTPRHTSTAEEVRRFLALPKNSIWMAFDRETPAGFIRYDGYDFDGVSLVESDSGFSITGAYVRPAYRGQRVAPALLDGALRDYAAQGIQRCSVNFESFNPEAAAFWPRYFTPVSYSLMRVPESVQF